MSITLMKIKENFTAHYQYFKVFINWTLRNILHSGNCVMNNYNGIRKSELRPQIGWIIRGK